MKDIIEQAGFTEYEIKKFTSAMRCKLLNNASKGDSWKTCDFGFLERKLVEEFSEFMSIRNRSIKDREELVDIANICMMLFLRLEMDI